MWKQLIIGLAALIFFSSIASAQTNLGPILATQVQIANTPNGCLNIASNIIGSTGTPCGTSGTGVLTAISAFTANVVPKATASYVLGPSLITDNGTLLTYSGTGGMSVTGGPFQVGSGTLTACGNAASCWAFIVGSLGSMGSVTGQGAIALDSSTSKFNVALPGGSPFVSLLNFQTVNLASTNAGGVNSTLGVANGGTGLSSYISGGVVCATGTGTLGSSGLLSSQSIMVGGGLGLCPFTIGATNLSGGTLTLGSPGLTVSGQLVLEGSTSGDTSFSAGSTGNLTITPTATVSILGGASANTYASSQNCAASGTAASPSVASCSTASAGSFACATNASGATCVVDTSAVTANSEIFITQRTDTTTGTALGVTCNTGIDTVQRAITAVTAGTSFTINLGTFTTHPECFSYDIKN